MSGVAAGVLYGFTVVSAAVSAGYSVKAWKTTTGEPKVFTRYTLVRSLVLLGFAMAAPLGGRAVLLAAAICLLALQLGDGLIGLAKHDAAEIYGPLTFAVISAGLIVWCFLA